MGIDDLVPDRWELCSADCSMRASRSRGVCTAMLVRCPEDRQLWHQIPESMLDSVDLYVHGSGKTVEEAIQDAATKITSVTAIHDAIHSTLDETS